ncbi:MAG TPA: biotin/lipoyl-binding protein, partial [Candidatus Lustribacter sp.]|nr:biotin/lipoyl-binding protein [Candidatus Lustribacter sp.]
MARRRASVTRGRPGWGRRGLGLGAVGLLVVVGAVAARAASAPTASAASYRTATAEKRAVEQRLVLTGTVARVAQKTAVFPMSATVTNVAVGVGDTVTAGQPLASVDRAPLTSELLDAEAQVAQAKATVESDQSSSASSTSTLAARSSGSSGSGAGTAALLRPVTLAMQAQERSCARVFGTTGGAVEGWVVDDEVG